MTLFLQIFGVVLFSVILVQTVKSHSKEIASILALTVCCIVIIAALRYLQPVLDFLKNLEQLGGLDESMVEVLLKSTGIGIITEIANLICKDAGNESSGKAIQLLGTAVILYLALPLFYTLIELLQRILGEL